MCAPDGQLRSNTADVYELTMNFTSKQVGGAQDYLVSYSARIRISVVEPEPEPEPEP